MVLVGAEAADDVDVSRGPRAHATSGGGEEAARAVKAAEVMSSSLDSMLALVPPKVVAQVRKREQALAALAARAAAPAEAHPAPGD